MNNKNDNLRHLSIGISAVLVSRFENSLNNYKMQLKIVQYESLMPRDLLFQNHLTNKSIIKKRMIIIKLRSTRLQDDKLNRS